MYKLCFRVSMIFLLGLTHLAGNVAPQLAMRIGLHSGPVTAGVLRGENARFQLFGDTVRGLAVAMNLSP